MPRGIYIRTGEHNRNNSKSKKGCIPWNKNIPATEERKIKQSKRMKGRPSPNKGKIMSENQKQKLRMSNPNYGKFGADCIFWKGGKKLSIMRMNNKRRQFGFIPLNNPEVDGWVAHHLDYNYVIFIPYELHHSIWHSITKNINMDLINDKVYGWFIEYYLKGDLL